MRYKRFWFNRDARLSIASVSIPYGQRFITIELEQQSKLLFTAAPNLYLTLSTEEFFSSGAGKGTKAAVALQTYRRMTSVEPVVVPTSTVNTSQTISTIDLYINNIFVNPEIHDIYIKRIGFSLIRVYRFQRETKNTSSAEILLSALKWPIETIFAGMRPRFNTTPAVRSGLSVTSGDVNEWRDWHRLTRLNDNVVYGTATSNGVWAIGNADPTALTPANFTPTANTQSIVTQTSRTLFPVSTKTMDTVKITAHGISIYQDLKTEFFANYTPYTYGGYNITTPSDEGALMIQFNLFPGTYQPSGHINVSRAREFYFSYTSSFVGFADANAPGTGTTPAEGELLIVAIAINFLLISDGSAVLRYST